MSELIETSKKYKEIADKILMETCLVEDLKRFGEVVFNGSYAYNLMMHGDVDITIIRENGYSIEEVFDIFKTFFFKRKFKSYFILSDWDDPRKGNSFPNGYYVGFKDVIDKEKWKFDLWFVSRKEFEEMNRRNTINLSSLTEEQRELILSFKKYRKENKSPITGQQIYELVLSGKCKNLEEFNKHLNSAH